MRMNGGVWGMLAETPVHYGAGTSAGVVDLPVARESTTAYPVIFGTGVKGSLNERVKGALGSAEDLRRWFGAQDQAGTLLVTDARLLLLPVRSLSGPYQWVTCPALLERWVRLLNMVGQVTSLMELPKVEAGEALTVGEDHPLFLEELVFAAREFPAMPQLAGELARLIRHESTRSRLDRQLSIVSDADMAHLCQHALTVTPHNVLDPETKTSINLWYEETLPPDTVMYMGIMSEDPGALARLYSILSDPPYLRLGANETVGQGWFALQAWEVPDGIQ